MYSVSGSQCSTGLIVSTRPASSQVSVYGPDGSIVSAPATDAGSIGLSKETVNGAVGGCAVPDRLEQVSGDGRGSRCGNGGARRGPQADDGAREEGSGRGDGEDP